jgi:hypothetical protein
MFARRGLAQALVVLSALGALACSGAASDDKSSCRNLDNGIPLCGPTSVQIPLEPGSSSPVILARIDGREARVLIDTGAQDPIVSSSWLGVTDAQWLRTQELCFGDLCLRGEQVYAQDTQFSQPAADGINGFIGMRTLRHFVVEFEHGNSVIFKQGEGACAGSRNPLTFGPEGTPFADISIDGQVFPQVTIDSGSSDTVLSQSTVNLLAGYVTAQSQVADLCTVNGCMTGVARTSTVDSYCVFGACQASVPVKYPVFDAVGSSYLFLQHTAFDFPGAAIVACE